jgi:dimethylamine corrinoid protein
MIDIVTAMAELDEDLVFQGVKEDVKQGVPVKEIISKLQQGMEKVGKLFEEGEYFLSELIASADIFQEAAEIFESSIKEGSSEDNNKPIMVLGTVKDDIHDVGKNIVNTIMSCSGVKVIDIGVDVPTENFVQAVKEHKPDLVGMSCVLTMAFEPMKEAVAAVRTADPEIPILIGGAPVDDTVCKYVGADYYCPDAYAAVKICKERGLLKND